MRQLYYLILMCLCLTACQNTDTVNILISNNSDVECHNVRVAVAMADITSHLQLNEGDTLFLLNEANEHIGFSSTSQGDSIAFVVPVLNSRSQKNYTVNAREKSLADYMFRFRTANVVVAVGGNN